MPIDVRKTATDAAYIAIGAGVLGFQQAQVRRRELAGQLGALRADVRSRLAGQGACLRSAAADLGAKAGDLPSKADELRTQVAEQVTQVADQVSATVAAVDPRDLVEPVLGDLKVRVEPVIEQVRAAAPVEAVANLVETAIATGRSYVPRSAETARASA